MFAKQTVSGKIAFCLIAVVVIGGLVVALFGAASSALKNGVPIYQTIGPSLAVYIGAVLATVAYLAPSLIASLRRHPGSGLLALLNIGLGWAVVGWLVALVWAFVSWRLPLSLSVGLGERTVRLTGDKALPEQEHGQKTKRWPLVVLSVVGVVGMVAGGLVYATLPEPYYSPAYARDMMRLTLRFSAACDRNSDRFTRELEGWKPFFIRSYGGDLQAMEKDLNKAIERAVSEAQHKVPTCAEVQEAYRISLVVRERHYASNGIINRYVSLLP